MEATKDNPIQSFKTSRLIWPVVIGLGVASIMLYRNFTPGAFENVHFNAKSYFWMSMAFLMVVLRDWAYMLRIRVLTDNFLNWRKAFQVIMLWEFASAVIPPSLGGGFAVAIYLLNKEKIELGKSVSVILFSSLLDGIFLGIMAPLAYFLAGGENLFVSLNIQVPEFLSYIINTKSISMTFWLVYIVVILYKLLVAYALFIDAKAVKNFLVTVFRLPLLRKFATAAQHTGDEMIMASAELKGKNFSYWFYSILTTFISWSARFLIINFIIAAFSPLYINHLLLYSKQIIIGILNIVSPTPGGSGLAEIMFSQFFKAELQNNLTLATALALLWRLISYYPYIFAGAIILPRWVKRVYDKK
ncbi:MAG: flippase-like domain-containing protein [Bacteroidia bacterium]|nr:flippase-like domain-containing protein [Bacteroidia bacterium]MCZ2247590.1 flippase-like domain-containing protein [Bacteroidia bacterium]